MPEFAPVTTTTPLSIASIFAPVPPAVPISLMATDRTRRSAVQQLLDVRSHFLRSHLGSEPLDDGALPVDEELLEVPRDVALRALAGLLVLQPLVQLARVVAVDRDLREHREVRLVLRRR